MRAANQLLAREGPGPCISTAAPSDWMEEGLQQCLPTITHVNCFGLIHSRPGTCPAQIY